MRLDGLALVEVEESAVDGGCVCGWVEVGQHLRLVSVGDFVDALDCAVGALHLLQRIRKFGPPASKHQADCLLPGGSFHGVSRLPSSPVSSWGVVDASFFLREEDELRWVWRWHLVGCEPLYAVANDDWLSRLTRDEGMATLFSEGRTRESHPIISAGLILYHLKNHEVVT